MLATSHALTSRWSVAEFFEPLPRLGAFRLEPVLDDLFRCLAGSFARAVGCRRSNGVQLRLRQGGEIEPCIGNAQLGGRRLAPLQVLDSNAELPGDSSQRLHGGRSSVSLDPGYVGVAHSWRREGALRHAALEPESLNPRTDRLVFRHNAIFLRAPAVR